MSEESRLGTPKTKARVLRYLENGIDAAQKAGKPYMNALYFKTIQAITKNTTVKDDDIITSPSKLGIKRAASANALSVMYNDCYWFLKDRHKLNKLHCWETGVD